MGCPNVRNVNCWCRIVWVPNYSSTYDVNQGGGGPSKNAGDAIVEEDGGAADDEVTFINLK